MTPYEHLELHPPEDPEPRLVTPPNLGDTPTYFTDRSPMVLVYVFVALGILGLGLVWWLR